MELINIIITAALARKVYLNTGDQRGVRTYKKVFGGKQRRGSHPPITVTGSESVIRAAIKQLTKLKVVELDPKGYVALSLSLLLFYYYYLLSIL